VHKRGRSNNLLVIEAKNSYSYHHGDKHDKDKIQAYIEDERYRYKFGVWICFYGKLSETRRDWFENIDGVCREVIDD
jgi:hypothetical protein